MTYATFRGEHRRSSVHVYAAEDGWWVEVGVGRRELNQGWAYPVSPGPCPSPADPAWDAWVSRWLEYEAALDDLLADGNEGVVWDWVRLPDRVAGYLFRAVAPGRCADLLVSLADGEGLVVPAETIDALRTEQAGWDSSAQHQRM